MKPDNLRKFVLVTKVDMDIDYDVELTTEESLLEQLKQCAENHYEQSTEAFSACVWDVENRTSTIYEYVCEKTVKVNCY
jgi:mannitol/fructose-specific phosphotransferase system IIA component (Ntr-type)